MYGTVDLFPARDILAIAKSFYDLQSSFQLAHPLLAQHQPGGMASGH